MKIFHDKGYHSILPDQLAAYYQTGAELPGLPFMITFDDAHVEQYTLALPVLEKYQFKAVFFVMTVCIDKKGFLSAKQIASLSSVGHVIGVHTWDHPNMAKQQQLNWKLEIDKPKKRLEEIIGKPINCFAFPYGAWTMQVLQGLKQRGFTTAFQLQGKQSAEQPLLTIRRIMVNGASKPELLIKHITTVFQ
ncbi:polysaccharide deacetylase family protein [Lacibacter sediminis]|uniref:Polysaccharide deacetylase family protein n=1 Tax=Lacibacter sediminis TaxID=2760713 RepID=A0A7G5XLP8_9BACT|nr:polysaccharide deacetylase family protein [Lacibacter sediminis]QNA46401.1 polysaccharide deacetylase family protein [Lacibacter sediminis]